MTQPQRLCLFVRSPRLGQVKTRLASSMGEAGALQAYQYLVAHTLRRLQPMSAVQRELCVAGDCSDATVQRWSALWRAQIRPQQGKDLGERMHQAIYAPFAAVGSQQHSAIIVGSDCPSIDTALVTLALTRLADDADVVVAPAEDGGYGLIGLRWRQPRAFAASPFAHVDWGTARVFDQTQERCTSLGLRLSVLPTVWDVDEADDWLRFKAEFGLPDLP
ncbi:MAG: TIGR04282 family arsenosugar biosynthesis glycosyltransferase [Pseudomonadales bacterium]